MCLLSKHVSDTLHVQCAQPYFSNAATLLESMKSVVFHELATISSEDILVVWKPFDVLFKNVHLKAFINSQYEHLRSNLSVHLLCNSQQNASKLIRKARNSLWPTIIAPAKDSGRLRCSTWRSILMAKHTTLYLFLAMIAGCHNCIRFSQCVSYLYKRYDFSCASTTTQFDRD